MPDAPARRNKSAAPMFGHRYDFNSSLSAAKNNAYAVLGEQSGLPVATTKQSSHEVPVVDAKVKSLSLKTEGAKTASSKVSTTAPAVSAPMTSATPAAIISEKPALSSESYQELVDKYCFFGSARSSPSIAKTTTYADGAADAESDSDTSVESAQTSGSWSPNMDQNVQPSDIKSSQVASSTSWTMMSRGSTTKIIPGVLGFPFDHMMSATASSPQTTAIAG